MLYSLENHAPQIDPQAWVAPNAVVVGNVQLAAEASVWFNCVLRGDTDALIVGAGSNLQDGSVLHTDAGLRLSIGRDCTIGHQVMLHGCSVGDNALIGIGAILLNGAVIGRNSIVGAGCLVPEGKVFPDGVLLLGSPAVIKRELKPEEIQMITLSARHYVANARRFRNGLRPFEQQAAP